VVLTGYILTALVAYLLGSIPTGFIVARAKGVDIRAVGSGNIGATNVLRVLGKPAGIFVLAVDAPKGILPVALGMHVLAPLFAGSPPGDHRVWYAVVGGLGAVLGHNYTCWLHFKGGKGIATSAGVLLGLVPWAFLIILAVWMLVFALTRIVSLASICASATLPFAAWLTGEALTLVWITAGMTVLAIYKHKANILRICQGTEPRVGLSRAPATSNQSSLK
jgi:glycerol-3-phosphate acyltransferase PlsY